MFVNPSEVSTSAAFFKPAELAKALVILFEPTKVLHDQVRTFKGAVTGTGTNVIADITVFENTGQLDAGTPVVMDGVSIEKNGVVRTLEKVIGQPMVGRLTKRTTNAGNTEWVISDADPADVAKVAAYYEQRQAALASAPSFD